MSFLALAVTAGCAGLSLLVGYWLRMAVERRPAPAPATPRAAIESQMERLRDEIWDLKQAAAQRDRAEAASEAKSRFLATVSHEMRTPLNGILGMAELMADAGLSSEQRAYLDAIHTSGAALASLIDEILDFSKIEAGKLDLVAAPLDVVALVEGVVELLAPRAQGKGLEIAASVGDDLPARLIGDEARLRQVLINLAGNAVKFTTSGGVGVRVSRISNGRIRFAVADTGPGVPEARRAAIFEEFEQADGSASSHAEGAGLGLAISRRLVEGMGGALRLESSSAQGSIFSFDIALPAAPDEARPAATNEAANNAPACDIGGRRVLIVARSPFEGPWLGERLSAAGADARRAEGLEQGLAALEQGPRFDIVIVDCALGEEATHRLAAAARQAGAARSLVLFSPFERRAFGQNSLNEFDGWLVKPVRSRSLLARLVDSGLARQDERRDDEATPVVPALNALLAEDNDINALVAQKHLQKLGARVTRVRDGAAAVAQMDMALAGAQPRFDVVLMDVRMPGVDGLEATRRIRLAEAERGAPRTLVFAVTANAFAEDRKACFAAGVDEFLTKPFDFRQLAQAIAARMPAQGEGAVTNVWNGYA